MRPRTSIPIALALALLGVPGRVGAREAEEARRPGVEAVVYGLPLVLMDATRKVSTNVAGPRDDGHAPVNQFGHFRKYPTAADRDVVRLNVDTLYSFAWLDLTKEPVVLSVPDTGGRYYLMPVLDAWTDVIASPGKRTTGTRAGHFAIVGPGWKGKLPEGVAELRSPTNLAMIAGRIQADGPADYEAVHAIQGGYKLEPLGAFGKPYTPPRGVVDPAIDAKTPPIEQVGRMKAGAFFATLAALLKENPPTEADAAMVAKLAKVGIVAGQAFDATKLDPALEGCVQAALAEIREAGRDFGRPVNGWRLPPEDVARFGADYETRAIIAAMGLGANLPQDAIYPTAFVDADGAPLTGADRYVLHFDAGATPPVRAFWSLTMYDERSFLVANPLHRYNLAGWMPLRYNRDGSLDLYLQADSPGKRWEANWLPTPPGAFSPTMRLYWPKEAAVDGRWAPPAILKREGGADPEAKTAKAVAATRPEDTKAIAEASRTFIEAYNRGDAKALAGHFAEDAEVSDEAGSTIRGRDAIAKHFAEALREAQGGTIELTTDSLRFLGRDAARETGRSRTKPGAGGSPEIARYTAFYVRVDGRWLLDSVEEATETRLTPHERLEELEWLLGEWVDEGEDGVVQTSCRWSDDRNFLLRDFTLHVSGQPFPGGSQRIGWDAGLGQFKSWIFDGDGGHSEGVWSRVGKDEWTIRTEGILADGREVRSTQHLTFVNKDRARWQSVDRVLGGESLPDSPEIVLVRKPPKAEPPARAAK